MDNKPRTKYEFAALYFNASYRSTMNWFRNEISSNNILKTKLQELGYSDKTKLMTIQQQRLCVEAWGEPPECRK